MNTESISYHKGVLNEIGFELNKLQEIELKRMFDFYWSQLKKERTKILNTLYSLFINKHDIFSDDSVSESKEQLTFEDLQRIQDIWSMMDRLEDISYHKQIDRK